MEFLIVHFVRSRRVKIDGEFMGRTEEVIELEKGRHEVTLGPPANFTPEQMTVNLKKTSVLKPREVTFDEVE